MASLSDAASQGETGETASCCLPFHLCCPRVNEEVVVNITGDSNSFIYIKSLM